MIDKHKYRSYLKDGKIYHGRKIYETRPRTKYRYLLIDIINPIINTYIDIRAKKGKMKAPREMVKL